MLARLGSSGVTSVEVVVPVEGGLVALPKKAESEMSASGLALSAPRSVARNRLLLLEIGDVDDREFGLTLITRFNAVAALACA
jgi:hypothetical protein